jgi:LysM repeat protein
MTLSATVVRVVLLLCGSLFLSGCLPSGASQLDEEREPHFMAGQRREQEMDYKGAVEEFELAAEVNPRSAAAHFELGTRLESDDPAAAIYHYERYLKLRPAAGNDDVVRQRIMLCKQDLARTVSLAPVTEKQQHDFEQLTAENLRLRAEVEKWQAYYSARTQVSSNAVSVGGNSNRADAASNGAQPAHSGTAEPRPTPGGHPAALPSPATHTHTVQHGETLARIARQSGVRLEVLMAANPGVEARRLRAGQILNIPSP